MNRLPLPKGKITIRHRAMRNVFQCFAGSQYLPGASGDFPEDAAQELANQYDITPGTIAKVYGYKEPSQIEIPRSNHKKEIDKTPLTDREFETIGRGLVNIITRGHSFEIVPIGKIGWYSLAVPGVSFLGTETLSELPLLVAQALDKTLDG